MIFQLPVAATFPTFPRMRTVTSPSVMQNLATRWQRTGRRVALVPTMGYLHAGHMSLVDRARRAVGKDGAVVVSVYVNPTQFAPHEDFKKYPRALSKDQALCREAGVDVVFAPTDHTMYPPSSRAPYSTFVLEEKLSLPMEGERRPTHFRGVTTVVAKLFHLVLPEVAVFGAKDFQQAVVIQRMVRDLNFAVKVIVAPTVRGADGLAISSRNRYLDRSLRAQARVLWASIQHARRSVRASSPAIPATRLRNLVRQLIEGQPAAAVEYIEFFDPRTLAPLKRVSRGAQMALAVRIGQTRLIDNGAL